MDDIDVVLGLTFLEAYNGVFKGKKRELVIQSDGQEFVLPLTKSNGAFGGRLNFISARELSEKCYMLVMRAGEARDGVAEKVELVPKCVEDVLKRYQDVMPEDLPNELPPRREVDHKIEVKSRTEPPLKAPSRLSQKELKELKSQLDELLAKGYIRQSKSPYGAPGIGRSRSLRLDSSPVWSRGSRQGLSRRQICLRQIFGAIDHRTRIHKAWIWNLG